MLKAVNAKVDLFLTILPLFYVKMSMLVTHTHFIVLNEYESVQMSMHVTHTHLTVMLTHLTVSKPNEYELLKWVCLFFLKDFNFFLHCFAFHNIGKSKDQKLLWHLFFLVSKNILITENFLKLKPLAYQGIHTYTTSYTIINNTTVQTI